MAHTDTFDMLFGLRRDSFFYKGRKSIMASLLKGGFRHAVQKAGRLKVADIGSGHGSLLLLDTLEEAGIKGAAVTGVDIDLTTLSRIKGMVGSGTGLVNADIMKLPFKRSFDMVVMLDVLEHVDDDAGLLRSVFDICNDGALLVMTVPAMSRTYGVFDKVASHKRRYDLADLSGKLTKAGFKVYKISYYIFFLMPAIFLFKSIRELALRLTRKEAGLGDVAENKVVPVVNDICLATLALEANLINMIDFPFGSSIIAIAGRP